MFRQSWQIISFMMNGLKQRRRLTTNQRRYIKSSVIRLYCTEKNRSKEVVLKSAFDEVEDKDKKTYVQLITMFAEKDVHRRGHVEFIYTALKHMEMFSVHKDLDVYKALLDVLPKGKFIPTNIFQAEFMHYPKQQQCAIDLLQQMEDNGVMPDYEMEDILLNVFGKRGHPLRKFWRMMYWMPKFKNLSPWKLPDPMPNDSFELAKLAIERISSVDLQAELKIFQTADVKDSIENTWLVSSQSPKQRQLLDEHDIKDPVYVEGSFKVWLRNKSVNYFVLKANCKPTKIEDDNSDDVSKIRFSAFNFMPPKPSNLMKLPSVHEQDDGTIFAVCATGTSSKDSLLSWIRLLQNDNGKLAEIPIVFTLRSPESGITVQDDQHKE